VAELTESQRRAVAIHEAGHAVAMFECGLPFDQVSVVETDDSYGRVTCVPTRQQLAISTFSRGSRRHHAIGFLTAYAFMVLAGPRSEYLLAGLHDDQADWWSGDLERFNSINRLMHPGAHQAVLEAWRDYLLTAVDDFVIRPVNRTRIETLASHLLKRPQINRAAVARIIGLKLPPGRPRSRRRRRVIPAFLIHPDGTFSINPEARGETS
jgi:hypothetical protein